MSNVKADAVPPLSKSAEPPCAAEATVDGPATGRAAEDAAAAGRLDHAASIRANGSSGGEA